MTKLSMILPVVNGREANKIAQMRFDAKSIAAADGCIAD